MSQKKKRIGTLVALHECLNGAKCTTKKTVTYNREQVVAMMDAVKKLLSDDGVGFMSADSKVNTD